MIPPVDSTPPPPYPPQPSPFPYPALAGVYRCFVYVLDVLRWLLCSSWRRGGDVVLDVGLTRNECVR